MPRSLGSAFPECLVILHAHRGGELSAGLEARSLLRLGVPSLGGRRQANKWESVSLEVSLKFVILLSVIAG